MTDKRKPESGNAGLSMSFSLSKKDGKRPKMDAPASALGFAAETEETTKDFVTGFDSNKIQSTAPKKKKKELVIPLQKVNRWVAPAGDALSSAAGEDVDAIQAPSKDGAGKDAEIGGAAVVVQPKESVKESIATNENDKPEKTLTLEERAVQALQNEATNAGDKDTGDNLSVPLLMQNRVPGYDDSKDEKEQYLHDVRMRPEEATIEEYEAVPIESFGAACLRGMGWKEGEAIGGAMKGLSTPIVGVPRLQGLGLGATRDKELKPDKRRPKKYIKPGESREKSNLVVARDADGRVRHNRRVDEELVEAEDVSIRKDGYVLIESGVHKDLFGTITKVAGTKVMVKLALGGEVVKTHELDLKAVPKAIFRQGLKNGGRLISQSKDRDRKIRDRDRDRDSGKSRSKKEEKSWLSESIRVRIVSSSFKNGKYYNKKVNIVDVIDPTTCTCITDEGKILEDVRQKHLETIIPKEIGKIVKVVQGRHAGRRGKMIEKSKSKEKVYVQLTGDSETLKLSFDEVSEYVGETGLEDW